MEKAPAKYQTDPAIWRQLPSVTGYPSATTTGTWVEWLQWQRWMLFASPITKKGSPRLIYCHYQVLNPPAAETNAELSMGHNFSEGPWSHWVTIEHARPLLLGKDQQFVLIVVDTYSRYRSAFPSLKGLRSIWSTIKRFQIISCESREFTLQKRCWGGWVRRYGILRM